MPIPPIPIKTGVGGTPPPPGPPVYAGSGDPTKPAVQGDSITGVPIGGIYQYGSGIGVAGNSGSGIGVQGSSDTGIGVQAKSTNANSGVGLHASGKQAAQFDGPVVIFGTVNSAAAVDHNIAQFTNSGNGSGVYASSQRGEGIQGETVQGQNGVHGKSSNAGGSGVWGENAGSGYGVSGSTNSANSAGVWGNNAGGDGVHGTSGGVGNGVWGQTGDPGRSGVAGSNTGNGNGVWGHSVGGNGIIGLSHSGLGGTFVSDANDGVHATSGGVGNGVWGQTGDPGRSGVAGSNTGNGNGVWGHSVGGNGIYGKSDTGFAGYFDGIVCVTKDVQLKGADCAEDFDISRPDGVEPGTVMVLGENGALEPSQKAYDKKVAGIISGAGDYRPGMVLDRQGSSENRMPVALMGKVYCKVDAQYGPIGVGDLLTASPTAGHAMRASDPLKSFGAVIGKALHRLDDGQGLIPVLVALQ